VVFSRQKASESPRSLHCYYMVVACCCIVDTFSLQVISQETDGVSTTKILQFLWLESWLIESETELASLLDLSSQSGRPHVSLHEAF
jgi:hypothetical protein